MRDLSRVAADQSCIGDTGFWCKSIESPLLGIFAFGVLALGAVFYYVDWKKKNK